MNKSCYIVIPNWNGIDLIEQCLEAVLAQTLKAHVIVVDNGSADGSNVLVREKFPDVELLEFTDNAGYSGGVNRGIRPALEAGAEYIALLNNDAVVDKHWLEKLVAAMETDRRVGAVAAKILTADGKRIDSTGDFYSVWGFPFPRGRGEEDRGQYDGPERREIFAASGGASLFRAVTLRHLGLMDERFFAYYEDTDLGFRMQLAGWKVVYEPAAVVRHYIGGTSARMDKRGKAKVAGTAGGSQAGQPDAAGRPQPSETGHDRPSAFARFHSVKNFAFVYTKNMPGWLYWKYLPRFWAAWMMMMVSDMKRGLLGSNVKANLRVLRQLPGVLADRRRLQRGRKVDVKEIDRRLVHELPPLQKLRFQRLGLMKDAK